MLKQFAFFLLFLCLSLGSTGQVTELKGVVYDVETHERLPFVNVLFKNTIIGVLTDTAGVFVLKVENPADTVMVSAMGYYPFEMAVSEVVSNPLQIRLQPNSISLDEISVRPDDGPVHRLMAKVVRNKERNNPAGLQRFSYRRYSLDDYRINNVSDNMMNWRIFREAGPGVFKYDEDSVRYMPVYFSEYVVFNEHQQQPARHLSRVEADNRAGLGMLEDSEISGFTTGLDVGIDFYSNSIELFGQNLMSPLADNGWFYYNYYLMDSLFTDNGTDYIVRFTPRRKGDNTFTGEMTIEDRFYSVAAVNARMTNTEHLNFIKDIGFTMTYDLIHDSIPFFCRTQINATVDYMPFETKKDHQRVELKVAMTHHYSDVSIGLEDPIQLSHHRLSYESVRDRQSRDRDEDYWKQVRPVDFSIEDLAFRASIDSVNQLPFIKVLDKLADMTVTGYYDVGKFGLGPYDNLLVLNEVQGAQLFFGGRTGTGISELFSLWGGVGYGTRNKEWLGRLGGGYMLPSQRRNILELEYRNDFITIGEDEKSLFLYENKQHTSESNLISYMFSRMDLYEVHRRRRLMGSIESEIRTGFSVKASAAWMRMYSPPFFPYMQGHSFVETFDATEAVVNFRWTWMERYMDYGYRRVYLGTTKPLVNLSLAVGKSTVNGREEFYSRVHSSLKHYIFMGQTRLDYALEGGAVFGTAPYPLLDLPRANITYGAQRYNFNMMNQLEFIHDKYFHAFFEYRLNGFLFQRTPLIRNTGWREVISAKAMMGDVRLKHSELMNFPVQLPAYNNKPYAEIGFGVENVFRFFRLDGIWRVSPTNNAPQFGLRARMELRI
jgi:hypothetical protein